MDDSNMFLMLVTILGKYLVVMKGRSSLHLLDVKVGVHERLFD